MCCLLKIEEGIRTPAFSGTYVFTLAKSWHVICTELNKLTTLVDNVTHIISMRIISEKQIATPSFICQFHDSVCTILNLESYGL